MTRIGPVVRGWAIVWLAGLTAAAWSGGHAAGQSIRCAGVLGNSGQFGPELVRMSPTTQELARPTGLWLDEEGAIWLGAGEAVVRLSLDGRLLERRALEGAGNRVDGFHFAALGTKLYMPGRTVRGPALLELDRTRPGAPVHVLDVQPADGGPFVLAAEPVDGRWLLAAGAKDDRITVRTIDPAEGAVVERFSVPGRHAAGLVWEPQRRIVYLGGQLRGATLESGILACDLHARPAGGRFPAAVTPTPAQPTAFRGRLSLAADALWDSGHYGYLARLDREAQGAPGIVCRWAHELDEITQVAALPIPRQSPTPLVVATSAGDACWLAQWDPVENQFLLRRRLGALPVISSLGISPDGWVTVGTAQSQYWWRWEDAANAPPRMADLSVACTPGVFIGEKFYAFGFVYGMHEQERRSPVPLVFSPRRYDRNSAVRPGGANPIQLKRPMGLALAPGRPPRLLVTDAHTRALWTCPVSPGEFLPKHDGWTRVAIDSAELTAPTDVALCEDGSIVVADAGRIWQLQPTDASWKVLRQYEGPPGDPLGEHVRMAIDGQWMVLSDSRRHRLLWIDLTDWKLLGQWGTTDRAGNTTEQLDQPTLVAIVGRRVVVADTSNQRIVQLELAPAVPR